MSKERAIWNMRILFFHLSIYSPHIQMIFHMSLLIHDYINGSMKRGIYL